MNYLPSGWTEATPGGMATCNNPQYGGIVDSEIVSGKWFVIFNDPDIPMIDNLETRGDAFEAYRMKMIDHVGRKGENVR